MQSYKILTTKDKSTSKTILNTLLSQSKTDLE